MEENQIRVESRLWPPSTSSARSMSATRNTTWSISLTAKPDISLLPFLFVRTIERLACPNTGHGLTTADHPHPGISSVRLVFDRKGTLISDVRAPSFLSESTVVPLREAKDRG